MSIYQCFDQACYNASPQITQANDMSMVENYALFSTLRLFFFMVNGVEYAPNPNPGKKAFAAMCLALGALL